MANKKVNKNLESEGEEIDPGEPIQELADLALLISPEFIPRLFRRFERRLLTVDLLDLNQVGIREMFLEYWHLVASFLWNNQSKYGKKED